MTRTIFVSSVQAEFAAERRAIKDFIEGDALLSRHFDVFLFEDQPAQGRSPKQVYLDEVDDCFGYVALFGANYGYEDENGISPTEREFDQAVLRRKERLVFIKAGTEGKRHPKEKALIAKAQAQLVRRTFVDQPDLTGKIYASLVHILETEGLIQSRPFAARAAQSASIDELDERRILTFLETAGKARNFSLKRATTAGEALEHLNLLVGGTPSNAAVLLFARSPKRFISGAFVTCLHFAGAEIARPVLSQNVLDGPLFEQIDATVSFVMSRLTRPVGTREAGAKIETEFEIPQAAIAEGIVNALAHRDYASGSAVHVRLFADRLDIASPGHLPRSLTPDQLKKAHPSIPGNPLVAEALFLAGYVERAGTGTLDMVTQCRAAGLPDPDFFQDGDEWIVRLWRDWLTEPNLQRLGLNDRQITALMVSKPDRVITTQRYVEVSGVKRSQAKRDLEDLVERGVLVAEGAGRGARYVFANKPVGGQI